MARITPESQLISLPEPQVVGCPVGWRKAERAITRLRILSRDSSVGNIDFSKIITREWSGFWYALSDRHIVLNGKIEFKNQQIYSDTSRWHAEAHAQTAAVRTPIPETTQPEENAEEVTELALWAGEAITGAVSGLSLPFIGDIVTFLADALDDVSSDDLYYLPNPDRPDEFVIDFPVGKVTGEIEFIWWPYSPLALAGGLAEIPIDDEIQLPNLDPPSQSLFNPIAETSLDQIARDNGYITPEECEVPPPEPVFHKRIVVSWTGQLTGGYTAYLNLPAGLAGNPLSAVSGNISSAAAIALNPNVLLRKPAPCSPLSDTVDSATSFPNSNNWVATIVVGADTYTVPLVSTELQPNLTVTMTQDDWVLCS